MKQIKNVVLTLLTILITGCSLSPTTVEPLVISKQCSYPTIIRPQPIAYNTIVIKYDSEKNLYTLDEQNMRLLNNTLSDVEYYIKSTNDIFNLIEHK